MKTYDKLKVIPATYIKNVKLTCEELMRTNLVNESTTIHELLLLVDFYNMEMKRIYELNKQENEYFNKKGIVMD